MQDLTKDAHYQHRRQANEDIDQGAKILYLFVDPEVPDDLTFGDVRAQAESLLFADRIAQLCDHLTGDHGLDDGHYEWLAVDATIAKAKRIIACGVPFPMPKGGRFRVRSQHEQKLWNECTRLIANAVVYYNSAILSEVLRAPDNQSNQDAIGALQRVTPLAWQHINFYGRYRFDGDSQAIDLTKMASTLASSESNRWGMSA